MGLSAIMRMRRRTRTEDSAQVHQTLFLLLGVGSGDETRAPRALARAKHEASLAGVVLKVGTGK